MWVSVRVRITVSLASQVMGTYFHDEVIEYVYVGVTVMVGSIGASVLGPLFLILLLFSFSSAAALSSASTARVFSSDLLISSSELFILPSIAAGGLCRRSFKRGTICSTHVSMGPPAATTPRSTQPSPIKSGRLKYAVAKALLSVSVHCQPVKPPHPFSLSCSPTPWSEAQFWML